ncbi:hypothetical protein sS8_4090 [Methylocaldum marinum]|uniref:Uncharacterized protein n=1 Tax=Methylocaldum marinum TaxID=1432792 RepID=A0A250KWJ7_9GAMM|nr:hypothetical protein sS8_4090 [Methylocaldum marinum]
MTRNLDTCGYIRADIDTKRCCENDILIFVETSHVKVLEIVISNRKAYRYRINVYK